MSASLSVLAPVTIVDAMLISSTAPEADYPEYVPATTYGTGARCISIATHRIYESLRENNMGNDPTKINNRAGAAPWWLDAGPTNKLAMFDGEVSTQTIVNSPLTVVVRPGVFNGMYLGKIDAEFLEYVVRDAPGGEVISSYSGDLENSAPGDYYEYFYDRFKPQTDFLASNIDPYSAPEITLTLSSTSGLVKCGVLSIGDLRPLGLTQYGAKAKPKSHSYVKLDDFGNSVIKRRKSARDMSASTWLKLSEANSVLDVTTDLLDVPCFWLGTDLPEYGGLRAFGLGTCEISYDHPKDCLLTLNVNGLI